MDADSELPPIAGGWTTREFAIADRAIRLTLPAIPERLLDDPDVLNANQRDDYMPYWAWLWPAAIKMAAAVPRADWPPRAEALEIGAGVGLVGVAALLRGLRVTFSDYEPKAIQLALHNARQNGFAEPRGLLLDWRDPPPRQFPVILGCDLLYEQRHHEPILALVERMLPSDGVCWLADGGRELASRFCRRVAEFGLQFDLLDEHLRPLPDTRIGQFQMIVLRHAARN